MFNVPRESVKTAANRTNTIETSSQVLPQDFHSMGNFHSSIDAAPGQKLSSLQPRQIAISEKFTRPKSIQSVNERSLSSVAHVPAGKVIQHVRCELDGYGNPVPTGEPRDDY